MKKIRVQYDNCFVTSLAVFPQRDDPERPEDQVLMRALRDYNVPKIVSDDVPVFMGLIGDLFPALDVPRKKDLDFEKAVKEAAVDLKLQPEDSFVLKVWRKTVKLIVHFCYIGECTGSPLCSIIMGYMGCILVF